MCIFCKTFVLPQNPPNCDQVVTTGAIDDRDPSCTPSVGCTVIPGIGSSYFDINCPGNVFTVVNTNPIDLDINPEYENIILLIEVRDSGSLTGYAKVVITVLNTNDFDPVFDPPGPYVKSVAGEHEVS